MPTSRPATITRVTPPATASPPELCVTPATADLNTTYIYFWELFKREALYNLECPGGSSYRYSVKPVRASVQSIYHIGEELKQEDEVYASEDLTICLVDWRTAEELATLDRRSRRLKSSELARVQLKWYQLAPNRLTITLSAAWQFVGHALGPVRFSFILSQPATKVSVDQFRNMHGIITTLYPEVRGQSTWMAAAPPDPHYAQYKEPMGQAPTGELTSEVEQANRVLSPEQIRQKLASLPYHSEEYWQTAFQWCEDFNEIEGQHFTQDQLLELTGLKARSHLTELKRRWKEGEKIVR